MDSVPHYITHRTSILEDEWRIQWGNLMKGHRDQWKLIGATRPRVLHLCHRAPNWESLSYLFQKYLRREVPVCASSAQLLYPETVGITPSLLRLYDYGIITAESSPGQTAGAPRLMQYDAVSETDITKVTKWCVCAERKWLRFLLPRNHAKISKDKVDAFVRILRQHPRLDVRAAPCYGMTESPHDFTPQVTHKIITADTQKDAVRMLEAGLWESERAGRLHMGDWCLVSAQSTMLSLEGTAFPAAMTADPMQFQIAAKDWNEEMDLQGIVEECLVVAGLKPVFKGIVERTGARASLKKGMKGLRSRLEQARSKLPVSDRSDS